LFLILNIKIPFYVLVFYFYKKRIFTSFN